MEEAGCLSVIFLLHPVGEIKSGDLRLDLWNAETTGCIRTTRGEIKLRACITSESPYILVEAEATAGEKEFTWKFYPENTDSPRQLNAIRKGNKNHLKKDYVSNPAPQLSARNGLSLCWQPCSPAAVLPQPGKRLGKRIQARLS